MSRLPRVRIVMLVLLVLSLVSLPARAEPRGAPAPTVTRIWQAILDLFPGLRMKSAPSTTQSAAAPNPSVGETGGDRGASLDPNGLDGDRGVDLDPDGLAGDRGASLDPDG